MQKLRSSLLFIISVLYIQFAVAQPKTLGNPELLIPASERKFQSPKWSPDGNKIAFTSARYVGVWIADANGENIRQLTDENSGYGFSWSPDSKSILARVNVTENRRRNHAVKIYHVNGDEPDQITDFRSEMSALPKWASFGEKVVLIENFEIESFNSGKEVEARFKQNPDQSFYILNTHSIAKGKIPANTTEDISPFKDAMYLNLTVSPDGQKLAFEVYGGDLYVMNVDGSNLISLGRANRPSWSPDSQYIAASISQDDGHSYQSSDLYAFKADGSESVNLTEDTDLIAMNPAWSPQGDKIAFDAIDEGAIYVLNIKR